MFFIFLHNTSSRGPFNICDAEDFERRRQVQWLSGNKIEIDIPNPLRYFARNRMPLKDLPFTGSSELLMSSKIVKAFRELDVMGVNFYPSQVLLRNGEIRSDYYTVNMLRIISCLDEPNSTYLKRSLGPAGEVLLFRKLSLDESRIPADAMFFRLEENCTVKIVHQTLKEAIEATGATGIEFHPVGVEYPGII